MNPGAAALGLFERALDQPESRRQDWIVGQARNADECDGALALLAAHARSEGFLEPAAEPPLPFMLGPWRLLALLGSGGMGRVYLAERADGAFEQRVAVKVLPGLLGDSAAQRRALRERQFLAGLEHPNIARIIDGGTSPEGQPYVVMEHVEGLRIDQWCAARQLDPRARVRLFLQVLDAVAAAHRALIVHRDIKPGNILVDADGRARLLDFGIAATLDEAASGETTQTRHITPRYASPEQILGKPLGTASDVYSLGLVLYELLSGQPARGEVDTSPARLAQLALAGPPTRPSRNIDIERLNLDRSAQRRWQQRLRGDLDRIVLKALAREPGQRYGSCESFAEDLRNWLDHRPVRARGEARGYRLWMLLQRNRWTVLAAGLGLAGLLLGLVVAIDQARQARAAAERAQQASSFLGEMIRQVDPYLSGAEPSLRVAIDRAAATVAQRFQNQPALESEIRIALGRAYLSLDALDAAREQLELAQRQAQGQSARIEAEALAALGTWAWSAGDYALAEAHYAQALQRVGRDAPHSDLRATVLNDYGAMLGEIGRLQEARDRLELGRALYRERGEQASRNALVLEGNLAGVLHGMGALEAADRLYRQAQQQLAALPESTLDLAISLGQHAAVLNDLGQYAQAAEALERSIALRSGPLGPEHPRLTVPLAMLAQVRARIGEHEAARRLIDTALALAPGIYSPDDPSLGHVHAAAARIALVRGDFAAARHHAYAALDIYSQQPGAVPESRIQLMQATLEAATGADPG